MSPSGNEPCALDDSRRALTACGSLDSREDVQAPASRGSRALLALLAPRSSLLLSFLLLPPPSSSSSLLPRLFPPPSAWRARAAGAARCGRTPGGATTGADRRAAYLRDAAALLLETPGIPMESLGEAWISRWSLEVLDSMFFFRNRDSGILSTEVLSTKMAARLIAVVRGEGYLTLFWSRMLAISRSRQRASEFGHGSPLPCLAASAHSAQRPTAAASLELRATERRNSGCRKHLGVSALFV